MKKYIVFTTILVIFSLLLASCSNSRNSVGTTSTPSSEQTSTRYVFVSEEDLQKSIKEGKVELKEYYKPVNIPENTVLDNISLNENTLVWEYYVGEKKPENFYSFTWMMKFDNGKQFINNCINMNNEQSYDFLTVETVSDMLTEEISNANSKIGISASEKQEKINTELQKYSSTIKSLEAKNILISGLGPFNKNKPLPKTVMNNPPPTWISHFSLDDTCFTVCVPYYIPERMLPFFYVVEIVAL